MSKNVVTKCGHGFASTPGALRASHIRSLLRPYTSPFLCITADTRVHVPSPSEPGDPGGMSRAGQSLLPFKRMVSYYFAAASRCYRFFSSASSASRPKRADLQFWITSWTLTNFTVQVEAMKALLPIKTEMSNHMKTLALSFDFSRRYHYHSILPAYVSSLPSHGTTRTQ